MLHCGHNAPRTGQQYCVETAIVPAEQQHLLQICGRYALHPKDADAAEEHRHDCQARHDRLAAVRLSQGVECCVCMERVLGKSAAAERKFGLLSCDHAFCLGCIRGWRSHHEGGADTDTVSPLASHTNRKREN